MMINYLLVHLIYLSTATHHIINLTTWQWTMLMKSSRSRQYQYHHHHHHIIIKVKLGLNNNTVFVLKNVGMYKKLLLTMEWTTSRGLHFMQAIEDKCGQIMLLYVSMSILHKVPGFQKSERRIKTRIKFSSFVIVSSSHSTGEWSEVSPSPKRKLPKRN